jgi:hypothetical protein
MKMVAMLAAAAALSVNSLPAMAQYNLSGQQAGGPLAGAARRLGLPSGAYVYGYPAPYAYVSPYGGYGYPAHFPPYAVYRRGPYQHYRGAYWLGQSIGYRRTYRRWR